MVRMLKGKPICEECYGELPYDERYPAEQDIDAEPINWGDLQSVTLSDLAE